MKYTYRQHIENDRAFDMLVELQKAGYLINEQLNHRKEGVFAVIELDIDREIEQRVLDRINARPGVSLEMGPF